MALVITTIPNPGEKQVQDAFRIAKELDIDYVPRESTIEGIRQKFGVEMVLVVGEPLTLFTGGKKLFFHPSMAVVRVKRMILGDTDLVVEISGVQYGDKVLDCTLGMGADSIVFAHAVGKTGSVIGIEMNPILALIVREGMGTWKTDIPELKRAMERVQVIYGHHLEYMRSLPNQSVDVVYFDPMFRDTIQQSGNLDLVRALSMSEPLSVASIQEAKRIARKSIVLKERATSGQFGSLGFPAPIRRSSSFTYSVIKQQGEE